MVTDSKLDFQAILAASKAASERIQQLPTWTQEAIRVVSNAAASPESRQVLGLSKL